METYTPLILDYFLLQAQNTELLISELYCILNNGRLLDQASEGHVLPLHCAASAVNGTDLKFSSWWHSLWQDLGLLATQVDNISLHCMTVTARSHKSLAVCEINRCCDLAACTSHWGLPSSIKLWKLPDNRSSIVCCISHGKWLLLSAS